MIYFYALLGVGMFSSIFGLLQISTGIIKQQISFNPSEQNQLNDQQILDKQFLTMLNGTDIQTVSQPLGTGINLCTNLKANTISNSSELDSPLSSFYSLLNNYQIDSNFIFSNNIINSKIYYKFLDGCSFDRQGSINHRVIILPP